MAEQLPPKRRECVRLDLSGAAKKKMEEASGRLGELMEARAAAEAGHGAGSMKALDSVC